jgi:membrane-associated phospholipid phosphatase
MKDTLYNNKAFFIPYSILLLIGTFFVVRFTKADIHLFINQFHSPFFDIFFKYLTYLGDGITLPLYLILMVMLRYRNAILLVIVFLISGLLVQILKRAFFSDVMRPVGFFKNIADLYLVPGVKQNCCNSFPSGHSATAFGIMVCFAISLKNNGLKFMVLILACLIAYSRMYLSQHFLIDIMVGSFIGTLTALICYLWINNWNATWLDRNILDLKKSD